MLELWFAYRLNKSVFRTTSDGQKLFCPHSYVGGGYIIPTDEVYKRILHGYIAFLIAAVPLGVIGVVLILNNNLLGFLGLLLLFVLVYFVWVRIEVRDLVKHRKS